MILTLVGLLLIAYACQAEVADKYKDMIIEKHNELRRKQNATFMFELVRHFIYMKHHHITFQHPFIHNMMFTYSHVAANTVRLLYIGGKGS